MNTSHIWRHSLVILIILCFTGCASTGGLHTKTPVTVKLANYRTILLYVSSQVPESSGETIQLGSIITDRLHNKGLFEKVLVASTSPGCRADLELNAEIVELKRVSPGARICLGALTGRAGVVVDVALTDMNTGTMIGSFRAEGKSSGGTVFAGTTIQAIECAAEQIVEFLERNM